MRAAVVNRDLIGQAKGILMERHRITADAAFALLAEASQHKNVKLTEVAAHLVETGELTGSPGPGQWDGPAIPAEHRPTTKRYRPSSARSAIFPPWSIRSLVSSALHVGSDRQVRKVPPLPAARAGQRALGYPSGKRRAGARVRPVSMYRVFVAGEPV
jgi:ANTAR domain